MLRTLFLGWHLYHVLLAPGAWASSSKARGVDGRLEGEVILLLQDKSLLQCVSACENNEGCKTFNRKKSSNTCELLSSHQCDEDMMLTDEPGWRYYELSNTYPELYELPMCVERGMCTPNCKRDLGESCAYNSQCQATLAHTQCDSTNGVCVCDTHHWEYDGLCIHKTSLDSSRWSWIFKKIVNGMCSVTFTTRAQKDLQIHLCELGDWRSYKSAYYILIGGNGNTLTLLKKDGTLQVTSSTPNILSNEYQNFTLQWCDGKIKFGPEFGTNVIAWEDPDPLTINGLGFKISAESDHAHMFFPHNLLDNYYAKTGSYEVLRTNGHHWVEYKILPDAGLVSSINFTFECKAPKDCKVMFGRGIDHSRCFIVFLGSELNERTQLLDGRTNSYVVDLTKPKLVSETEFRRFWIHIDGGSIVVGQGSENTTPLYSYTDPVESTRTFSHIAISTCCDDLGFWKIHSHPQFHQYPNGAYIV